MGFPWISLIPIGGVNFTPYLFSLVLFVPGPTFQERGLEKPVGYNMPDVYDDEDGKGAGEGHDREMMSVGMVGSAGSNWGVLTLEEMGEPQ